VFAAELGLLFTPVKQLPQNCTFSNNFNELQRYGRRTAPSSLATLCSGLEMAAANRHHRIEQFLTGQTLNTLFSLFNLVIFGAVLAFYNLTIFGVLILSALLYAGWVMLFLKFRRKLDYQRFGVSAKSNSTLVQLIQGMHEIRLAGAETPMRW
jgi:ABC-type bacteriocin/lantibiotic exporter with double-glycine peptidase domain